MESQESLEFSAKTVDEAVKLALEKLGLKQDEVEITVIKKGRPGILGLGVEEARIQVRPLPSSGEAEVSTVVQEVVQKMLQAMGLTATIHTIPPPPQGLTPGAKLVALDIRGNDLGALIGRRGQTLISLQYLVNLIVTQRLKSRIPIMLDVEGYKARRYTNLHTLALRMAEQVAATKQPVTLEPMPANERRIVHLALADHLQVTTQGVGIGEGRKVVILPKDKTTRPATKEGEGEEQDL